MRHYKFSVKTVKGFSLIELLISGFLGIILLAGVISLFISSRQTFRVQEQLGNIQTDGRFALMFIERFVENAGWFEELAPADPFSAVDYTNSNDGGGAANDAVAFAMEVVAGTGIDCNGSVVAGTRVINRFFVNGTTLMCQGNGGAIPWNSPPQPVIENVESFQVLYGADTDGDQVVDRYFNADQVVATGNNQKVVAIKVGLLVVSQNNVAETAVARSYQVADVQVDRNDRLLRRAFNKTIIMPNQAFALVHINAQPNQ